MKKIRIILSPEVEKSFAELEKEAQTQKVAQSILRSIQQKIELIKQNPHYGEPVSKKLIPVEWIQKYGIHNLFHVELANYWRLMYSLVRSMNENEIIAFVLNISSHPEYDKKMGYR